MIQTVRGMIDENRIHNTLAHEHFVFGLPGLNGEKDNCFDKETALKNILGQLDLIKDDQVDLIVDPTMIEWGRDPLFLQDISERTGMNIVAATGFYKDEDDTLSFLKSLSYICDLRKWMTDLFVREIEEGMGSTGIRAGIIKVATSLNEIKPLEKTILEAAAIAQSRTDAAVFTHCDRGTMGLQQLDILLENNAGNKKIVIGHQTSNRDLNEVKAIMDRGVLVGFDQFSILSIPGIPNDEEKMRNLLELLKSGYEDHIVLSHDCAFDRMGYVSKSKPRHIDIVYGKVLPFLRENGISETAIRKISRDNLLRVLSF